MFIVQRMRHYLLYLFSLLAIAATAQTADYTELDDGSQPDAEKWGQLEKRLYATWASRDTHYEKRAVPQLRMKRDTVVYAWRGERVGVEALLFSSQQTQKLSLALRNTEPLNVTARFLRYVLTDDFKSCGSHPTNLTPYLVPDVIDLENSLALPAKSVRPAWLTIEVPRDIAAGEYSLALDIKAGTGSTAQTLETLTLRVVVRDHTLPLPSEQAFHLDFWQQPYSVSRYYNVARWSNEHLELLRPYMQLLARAGQSVVSAILFYEPWGDQSHDKFSAMVQTTKKANGTWAYDYTVFDRWVTFMEECGISKQIDCFSMVPWDMTFRYYDEATGRDKDLKTTTSAAEYKELWTSFLTSFAAHLKEKGWFEKTLIAMDERGLSNMLDAYNVAQEAVPGIKMALAGNYHSELMDKLADYCIPFGHSFPASEQAARREKGWYSTFYTCCTEKEPNILTNSKPAEAAYLPLYGIANDFDGYLHWSWLNWQDTPLTDSRYRLFSPGDTYVVYPGPRSSVRWERFIEGIQQTEKVRILRQQYQAEGKTEELRRLNAAVEAFKSGILTYMEPASKVVNHLESVVNDAPEPAPEPVFDYCPVMLPDSKRDIAIEKRWLEKLETTGCLTNLNYQSSSPSVDGYVITPQTIVCERGSKFILHSVANQNDDDLRYCRLLVVADWTGDSIFDTSTAEKIVALGSANTANTALLDRRITVRVPADAKLGLRRLRMAYADAWTDAPQPCGELYKGFAIDVPMEIVEAGTGVNMPTTAAEIGRWSGDTLLLASPANVFVYDTAGVLLDKAAGVRAYSIRDYMPGTYVCLAVSQEGTRAQYKFLKTSPLR